MTDIFCSDPHSGSRATRLEKSLGFRITAAEEPILIHEGRKRPALLAETNMWLLLMAAPKGVAEVGLLNAPSRGCRS